MLVDVGDGRTENAAVASLVTADPVVLPDRPTRLRAGIRNFGPANLAGLRVELYVDGYLAAFKSADVPAREETVVEFQHEFHAAGEHVVEARLPPDRLGGGQPALAQRAGRPADERAGRQRPRGGPTRGERLVLRADGPGPLDVARIVERRDAAEGDQRGRSGRGGPLAVRLRLLVQRGARHADRGGALAGLRRGGRRSRLHARRPRQTGELQRAFVS